MERCIWAYSNAGDTDDDSIGRGRSMDAGDEEDCGRAGRGWWEWGRDGGRMEQPAGRAANVEVVARRGVRCTLQRLALMHMPGGMQGLLRSACEGGTGPVGCPLSSATRRPPGIARHASCQSALAERRCEAHHTRPVLPFPASSHRPAGAVAAVSRAERLRIIGGGGGGG